jgi:putative hydrolase of HD superfamily
MEIEACPKRTCNNFFASLFHDLPEVLTRDIVSPIKDSVAGLHDIIKEYEKIQIEERLLPLLPTSWHGDIRYLIEDEFENKIKKGGKIVKGISFKEIASKYNKDSFSAIDGELLKACDRLTAFIEASLSIKHGIKSRKLVEGKKELFEMYRNKKVAGIDFGKIYADFE